MVQISEGQGWRKMTEVVDQNMSDAWYDRNAQPKELRDCLIVEQYVVAFPQLESVVIV